jgi:hypothetical protein
MSGELRYRWDEREAVVMRGLSLVAERDTVTLMRAELLEFESPELVMTAGEQGFPVYMDGTFFASVAHPAGWAIGDAGHLVLRQFPGRRLLAGEAWEAMPSIIGAAGPAGPRVAFLDHVSQRMRRSVRGHDRPISIGTAFGSWDYDPATAAGPYAEVISQEPDEATLLINLAHLREARAEGFELDWFVLDFWVDQRADLDQPDMRRFPGGFGPVRQAATSAGAGFGLWLDSSMAAWTIGENPLVSGCFTHDPDYGTERASLCWASEPYRSLASGGYVHLVEQEGAGLLKFDNLQSMCYATDHDHLPGIWSTEAIMSSVIAAMRTIDERAPDTVLMLYWGYRSPWWLNDADTLFEPGFWIEAAHPAASPTLYVRDSVIQGLDQAQRFCRDVPALGKDSLGVWLSDWKWNSSIGTERWQEAMVMDVCRGSLLMQLWSDKTWMTSPDRRQVARLIALVKAYPRAFAASRAVGGDPWRDEPYGYVCSDGERAFVALFNATWSDTSLPLELGPAWNLPVHDGWRVLRHYPEPADLTATDPVHLGTPYHLRPFEIVLLECLPDDVTPALGRQHAPAAFPSGFIEPTVPLDVSLREQPDLAPLELPLETAPSVASSGPTRPGTDDPPPRRTYLLQTRLPVSRTGSTAVIWLRLSRAGTPLPLDDVGSHFAAVGTIDDQPVAVAPVVRDRTYSTPWQAWRIAVEPGTTAMRLELRVTTALDPETTLEPAGSLIPDSRSDR